MRKKYHVALTGDERRLLLEALIFKKIKLLVEGRYTDAIDEIILDVMKAKSLSNLISLCRSLSSDHFVRNSVYIPSVL